MLGKEQSKGGETERGLNGASGVKGLEGGGAAEQCWDVAVFDVKETGRRWRCGLAGVMRYQVGARTAVAWWSERGWR